MKDHDSRNVITSFPTIPDLEALSYTFYESYKKARIGILDRNTKQFQDNYIAMNQTHNLLRHLDKKYEISETIDLNKMQDKMYYLQLSKVNMDKLWN